MSKKILIDEALFELVLSALENESVYRSASKAFREAKEKHYSVLEWHPVSEKPSEEKPLLVRYKTDKRTYYLYDNFEINSFFKSDTAKEWAYLPE